MVVNKQPRSKVSYRADGFLELHHCFRTIQGEGPFVGTPAVFIRLAGCNLQCPFCDTDYTSHSTLCSPQSIVEQVKELQPKRGLVVISGGEPLRQNIGPLVQELAAYDYAIQVETNGTAFAPILDIYRLATIVCSPKTGFLHPELAHKIHAFKYVLQADFVGEDGLPISTLGSQKHGVARPPENTTAEIYVQPLDEQNAERNEKNTRATIDSCLRFGFRLCLQTQKIVNIE